MTGKELRRIRTAAGFTTRQLAAIVGVTAGAITRWEGSDRPIPESMVRYLRLLQANGWKHEIDPPRERASA